MPRERMPGSEHWWSSPGPNKARSARKFDPAELGADTEFLRETGNLLLLHKFAIDEVMTRLRIWNEEFDHAHEHDPIEHITSRVKRPEAIAAKLQRRGLPINPASAWENLDDIAGVRVVCPFVSDVYLVHGLFRMHGIEIVQVKDYIVAPKPNGYRSLHLIAKVPVHLSDRTRLITVEIQLRTIAMDFWAAVEHELSYKSGGQLPPDFATELKAAADTAADLDARMKSLHERTATAHPD